MPLRAHAADASSKSTRAWTKPIVVVNKVDKPNCEPDLAYEKVFDLMFSLDASEEQLDFLITVPPEQLDGA